ncbi:hypothetical protein GCM10009716_32100 [Streptomyces sodiiphilus]|uniref:Uncharacterized protein n=1 Tax=Streptomyces sodiiphilus TaxID=226217 RepID=A0ABN2PI92_9ACTN
MDEDFGAWLLKEDFQHRSSPGPFRLKRVSVIEVSFHPKISEQGPGVYVRPKPLPGDVGGQPGPMLHL